MKNMFLKKLLFATAFISIATVIGIAGYLYFAKQKSVLAQTAGKSWYVDNAATGLNNGTSWANAWQSFAAIGWTTIQPGDTIYISGGTASKTYNENLNINKSGVFGSPIIIKVGQEAGHDGTVIIDPNFSTMDSYHKYGILIMKDYIVIDGQVNGVRKMLVRNAYEQGIGISGIGVKVTYLEITNNGSALAYVPSNIGISLSSNPTVASPVEVSYSYIHDPANMDQNITIKKSSVGIATDYGRVLIHHNTFYNADGDHIESALGGLDIYNNEFSNSPSVIGYDTLHLMSDYNRIYNNKFHTMYGGGFIYLQYTAGYTNPIAGHTVIENNLFYDNATSGSGGIGQSFYVQSSDIGTLSIEGFTDIYIINNVFDGVRGAINIVPDAETSWDANKDNSSSISNYYVVNNIIKNSVGYAIALANLGDGSITTGSYGSRANIIFDNNNIYSDGLANHTTQHEYGGSYKAYPAAWKSSCGCAIHDQSDIDPLFSVGNYSITSASPARDNGVAIPYFGLPLSNDYAGISRPQGSAWDIGAYEYIQASPPLKGDFNSDQKVNNLDFASFKNAFKSLFNSIFDLNSDSTIDVRDLGVLMNSWLP